MTGARTLAVLAVLLAAGCKSQWYEGLSVHDIAKTDVEIRTEPSGALVSIDGAPLSQPSPVLMPIEYDHTETEWERQTNAGIEMRDKMGPLMKVITIPITAVASLFHEKESIRRHVYGNNVHTFSAELPGHDVVEEIVTLEGESKRIVSLKLPVSK